MATLGLWDERNPLKKVVPPVGAQVQNVGGLAPNTTDFSKRPAATPGVNLASPGAPPLGAAITPLQPAGSVAGSPLAQSKTAAITPPPAAPAPAPVAPAAPAPAPSAMTYGAGGGGTPSLEDQLRGIITGFASGATSKGFIDRAKQQLGSAVEGQRAQGVKRINEDAIRRGLFRSGIPAEGIAAAETGARGALSQGIADILSKAEQQDIAAKESAGGMAGNLLSANRQWDMYQQQRADEQAARAAANRPEDTSFTYVDPDTGESYQMDETWFQ